MDLPDRSSKLMIKHWRSTVMELLDNFSLSTWVVAALVVRCLVLVCWVECTCMKEMLSMLLNLHVPRQITSGSGGCAWEPCLGFVSNEVPCLHSPLIERFLHGSHVQEVTCGKCIEFLSWL